MIRQYKLPQRATATGCDSVPLGSGHIGMRHEVHETLTMEACSKFSSLFVFHTVLIVPNTNSSLVPLPSDSKHCSVVDLSSAYFSLPLHQDSQEGNVFFLRHDLLQSSMDL